MWCYACWCRDSRSRRPRQVSEFRLVGTAAPNVFDQRIFIGELAGVVLRVDQRAVNVDVEDPTRAGDQERFAAERIFKLGRQTDGVGLVVSLHAVGDGDIHDSLRVDDANASSFLQSELLC